MFPRVSVHCLTFSFLSSKYLVKEKKKSMVKSKRKFCRINDTWSIKESILLKFSINLNFCQFISNK